MKRLANLLISSLFLSACATAPTSLKIAPHIDETSPIMQIATQNNWQLASKDFRTARYLIAISSGDKVATLINESDNSRLAIEKTLQTHWLKQGLIFDKESDYKIEIQLMKLLTEVEESSLSYEADIDVVIKVELSSKAKTFSKTFRSHYEEKAPFSADSVELTTQLNTQLSQLLNQIVQDPELNAKLATL